MAGKVIAVVDDLFFASKIRGTGEQVGVTVTFARSIDALVAAASRDSPSLIICDLHATRVDPFAMAREVKADQTLRAIPLLGFFSHVQTELQRQAEEAGFDRVMPRSAFATHLIEILTGTGND